VQAIRSTVATVRASIVLLRKVLGLEQAASLVVGQAALAAANPCRRAAADVIYGQCLPAAGKFARLGGRERSVSSRLGALYSSRFLMIDLNKACL
jgi:hypothetical protein